MIVAVLALAIFLVGMLLLFVLGVSPFHAFWFVVVGLIVLTWVAQQRDRARQRGRHDPGSKMPRWRGDFHGRSSQHRWEVPTAYIDQPTGGGPPPGVQRGDERPPRR